MPISLKLLPAYTGVGSLEEALRDARSRRLLWLEILMNDQLELAPWLGDTVAQDAYRKACRWYTSYRSVIDSVLTRTPLPTDPGPIDAREYRTLQRHYTLQRSQLTAFTLLAEYVQQTDATIDLLLIGGLLQAYGDTNRATQDVDGELTGELDATGTVSC